MDEPIFLNLCSFDAFAVILRDIGRQSGVRQYRGTREWLSVMCDGLPYTLCQQLIERFMHCTACHQHCDGADDVTRHLAFQHDGDETIVFEKEFAWVLLQPGPGHIEMNMLKGFVKLMRSVYWEDMVEVFSFWSENAKKSAFSISDHHKGLILARIAQESVAWELVTPYLRHELCKSDTDRDLSVLGFFKYCLMYVENPNYALFSYQAGLRSGNAHLVEAARGSSAKLCQGCTIQCTDSWTHMMLSCLCVCPRPCDSKWEPRAASTPGAFHSQVKGWLQVGGTEQGCSALGPYWWWLANCLFKLQPSHKAQGANFWPNGRSGSQVQRSLTPSDITKQVMAFSAVLQEWEYLSDPESKVPHASLSG